MKLSCRLWIGMLAFGLVLTTFARRPAMPYFPDIEGYKTLVCDFHTHTVFSDGTVWPTERIEEAWRERLDAIALTDHIEHQPHSRDIPTQHERPYAIALPKAQELNVLLIKGTEITKSTPPGHYNAIFVKQIDPIDQPDVLDAVRIAAEQNAFVFWNHHTWQGVDRGQWEEVQTTMYENKWLHGMEVANGDSYYPLAHQWCLDKNLTMIGTSDIHEPSIDYIYTPHQHRTLTLVLAKERSIDAIREAVFAGRTLVWHENRLIGRQPLLEAMYAASVSVSAVHFTRGNTGFFEISNRAFLDLSLERTGRIGPARSRIPARSTVQVRAAGAQEDSPSQTLTYTVTNLLIAPNKGLPVEI